MSRTTLVGDTAFIEDEGESGEITIVRGNQRFVVPLTHLQELVAALHAVRSQSAANEALRGLYDGVHALPV